MSIRISISSNIGQGKEFPAALAPHRLKTIMLSHRPATLLQAEELPEIVYSEVMRRQIRLIHRASLNHGSVTTGVDTRSYMSEALLSNIFSNIAASRICASEANGASSVVGCCSGPSLNEND